MGKKIDSSVLDAALNKLATATTLVFCSAEPANFAGIAAVALATKTGLTGASFTIGAGSGTNRKITVGSQQGLTPTADGTITYACLHDGATLLLGEPVASQPVTTTTTWNSPTFTWEIAQPT